MKTLIVCIIVFALLIIGARLSEPPEIDWKTVDMTEILGPVWEDMNELSK